MDRYAAWRRLCRCGHRRSPIARRNSTLRGVGQLHGDRCALPGNVQREGPHRKTARPDSLAPERSALNSIVSGLQQNPGPASNESTGAIVSSSPADVTTTSPPLPVPSSSSTMVSPNVKRSGSRDGGKAGESPQPELPIKYMTEPRMVAGMTTKGARLALVTLTCFPPSTERRARLPGPATKTERAAAFCHFSLQAVGCTVPFSIGTSRRIDPRDPPPEPRATPHYPCCAL